MQKIHFHPRYLDSVRAGRKTRTTRFRDPVTLGEAILEFRPEGQRPVRLSAVVTDVRETTLKQLTDVDARREDLNSAEDLRDVLRWHYPEIAADDHVQVVSFRLL